jgi:small nuclear ribonucleoprotein (snRNP)-like protein
MKPQASPFTLNGEFFRKYEGKRIEIHCVDGGVMQGRVGEVDQSDYKGFFFHDDTVTVNEREFPYNRIVDESEIASFTPLEGENPPVRVGYPVDDVALRIHQGKIIEAHLRNGEVLAGRVVQVDKKPRVELQFTLQVGQENRVLKKGEVTFYYCSDDGWKNESLEGENTEEFIKTHF